jgi:hypothetical protein
MLTYADLRVARKAVADRVAISGNDHFGVGVALESGFYQRDDCQQHHCLPVVEP